MKIYTRLINEGFFAFWNDDKENTYNIKVRILVDNQKIVLVNVMLDKGIKYYSMTNIGTGEYEIEVSSYNNSELINSEKKTINLISSVQKQTEILDSITKLGTQLGETYDLLCEIHDWCSLIYKK